MRLEILQKSIGLLFVELLVAKRYRFFACCETNELFECIQGVHPVLRQPTEIGPTRYGIARRLDLAADIEQMSQPQRQLLYVGFEFLPGTRFGSGGWRNSGFGPYIQDPR